MGSFFCKIWRFLVGFIMAVVELVGDVLLALGEVAFKLLDQLVESASSLLDSLFSSPLLLLALGAGAIWFLTKDDDGNDDKEGTTYALLDRGSSNGFV